jgi:signal peptidase I
MSEIILSHAEFADLSTRILQRGTSLRFTAHGSSMSPFIRDGDVMTVEPVRVAALKVGDVVFYHTNSEMLVAHRVVGRHVEGDEIVLTMRGDSSLRYDEKVHADRVLGSVVNVERGKKVFHLQKGLMRVLPLIWITSTPLRSIILRIAYRLKKALAEII